MGQRLAQLSLERSTIVIVAVEKLAAHVEAAKQIQFRAFAPDRVIPDSTSQHRAQVQVLKTIVFEIREPIAKPLAVDVAIVTRTEAKEYGLSDAAWYRLIREGKIKVIRIGRKIIVPRPAFLVWYNTAGGQVEGGSNHAA